jgi:hypothetical protein
MVRDMEAWKTKLKPEEALRYEELHAINNANNQERRKIYDRCRKRLERDAVKT